jgi:5,10-methylenetetrahydromethanopterin reductase
VTLGLRLPPCAPIDAVAAFAQRAEAAGADVVWIPDSQFLWRDVWATAALVADRTERIGIGVAVTNFETRHVAVTASAIASIDELSGRRLRVALGTGDSSVKTIGRRPTSLRAMREQIGALRALLRGEQVAFSGEARYGARQMRLHHALGRAVPLYLAASGPKALALAGELCDGVILAAGVAPALVQRSLQRVAEGAERAGRRLDDLDIWLAAYTVVAPDEQAALRTVKPLCVAMAQLGAHDALRAIGIELDVPEVIDGLYPDVTHAERWELAIAAAERYVDDADAARFADSFTLIGTADQVRARIERATSSTGLRAIYALSPSSYEVPEAQLQTLPTLSVSPRSCAMSHVETVREMYAAFLRGDFQTLYDSLDPDVEWAEPDLDALPYPGVTVGRDVIASEVFPKIAETYERLEFHPEQLIDGGDVVTVLGTAYAKGRHQPQETFPFAHVMRLRDGRVVRFDHFVDTNKIARTLAPAPPVAAA